MNIKNIIDTIFNSEETTPKSMLQSFHKLVEVLTDYVEEHAIQGEDGKQGKQGVGFYTTTAYIGSTTGTLNIEDVNLEGNELKVGDSVITNVSAVRGNVGRITSISADGLKASWRYFTNLRGPQGPVGPFGGKLPLDSEGKLSVDYLKNVIEFVSNTFFVDMNYADDDIGKITIKYGTEDIAVVEPATFIKIYIDNYKIVITNLGNVTAYNIDPQEPDYIQFIGLEDVVVTAVNTY